MGMSRGKGHRGPGPGGPGGPMYGAPGGKAKDFKGSLKRLAGYLSPHRARIIVVLALAVLSVAFSIVGPKILAGATNEIFGGVVGKQAGEMIRAYVPGITDEQLAAISKDQLLEMLKSAPQGELDDQSVQQLTDMLRGVDFTPGKGVDFAAVARIVLTVASVYLLASVFAWGQQFIMARVSERSMYKMRKDVDEKIARLPLKYFDSTTRGEVLSRITGDVDNIARTLSQNMTQLINSVLSIVGVMIIMFTIDPLLALITSAALPVSLIIALSVAKRSQKHFAEQWNSNGKLNSHVEEAFTGHNIIAAFNKQDEIIDAFDKENRRLAKSSFKAQFISGVIMPAINMVSNLNFVINCVVGGLRVARGTMTLGDVQAFIQYSRQFTQPITQASSIINVIQSTIASAERVFEFLDEAEEIPDTATPKTIENVQGRVELKNVCFGYDPQMPLMQDLNLVVEPGHTIAIVGPTGAGKTTLVNLLLRFYEIGSGEILIDGVNIKDMTRDHLRSMFGMVLQDTWQFSGSIYDNIAYGRDGVSEAEVMAAAKAAYVDHFVRTLPEGYATVLSDDAANISQGQRQLLTIARAFVANPQILILDEATSSVDTRTEVLIQKAMSKLMAGHTAFVIAHRLSTIRDADTILVMRKGAIVEQGNHEQLLAQKGFYYDLYNSQFENPAAAV